jgi:hypothetical protein
MADPEGWSVKTTVTDAAVSSCSASDAAKSSVPLRTRTMSISPARLTHVTFLDSSGMMHRSSSTSGARALLVAHRRSAALGRPLTVVRTSRPVRRIIQLSGTASLFAVEDVDDEGLHPR